MIWTGIMLLVPPVVSLAKDVYTQAFILSERTSYLNN
jgi:hypothetical protein